MIEDALATDPGMHGPQLALADIRARLSNALRQLTAEEPANDPAVRDSAVTLAGLLTHANRGGVHPFPSLDRWAASSARPPGG